MRFIYFDFLWQIAKAQRRELNLAIIEFLLTKNHLKKRGFASAINANNANFVASIKMKATVVVDFLVTKR